MSNEQTPLEGLYPFLQAGADAHRCDDSTLAESIARKAGDSGAVKNAFFAASADAIIAAARALADVYRGGGRVLTMGNGGSSCDAAHFAVEFQHPVTAGRPALPAINLCADTAMLTAVANDLGARHLFLRQVEAHGRAGDALVGFSTSGNSANLVEAFMRARALGLTTLGFSGGDGGEMAEPGLLDHCLVVGSDSIHRVQETHVACYHILWDLVHTLLADRRGKLGQALGQG